MSHITLEQRYQIQALLQAGKKQSEIALIINKSKSSISRELSRNSLHSGQYKPLVAQDYYKYRRSHCQRKSKWLNTSLTDFVVTQLQEQKSPEQISGIMHKDQHAMLISHEAIYQYIWKDKRKGGKLSEHLRNKGRKYQKRSKSKATRGLIPNRVGIEQRPAIVEERKRVGDFEIDLVLGKNHQYPILTIVERKSGFALLRKLSSKESTTTAQQLIDALLPIKEHIHTITSDNGKEFAQHETVAQALNAAYYFAKPYHSWQRGSNENYNRLLRQYFPKKTAFDNITQEQLLKVQNKLNNRERKRLGFLSPIQYLHHLLLTKVAFTT